MIKVDNCGECQFNGKCKNTPGIDNAYGGLECVQIWKKAGEASPADNQVSQPGEIGSKGGPKNLGWPEVDKKKYECYLTVGRLKEVIKNMPDDALVFSQRVEDVYFEEHGWETLKRPWLECPEDEDGEQYINIFNAFRYKDIDEHLYLTPHY